MQKNKKAASIPMSREEYWRFLDRLIGEGDPDQGMRLALALIDQGAIRLPGQKPAKALRAPADI